MEQTAVAQHQHGLVGDGVRVVEVVGRKEDRQPVGVPKQIARFAAEYQVPGFPALALTGGYSFTSKTWFDSANKLVAPSSMAADAGARFVARRGEKQALLFRLNVTNLANSNYWTNPGGSLNLGSPRAYACSTEWRF